MGVVHHMDELYVKMGRLHIEKARAWSASEDMHQVLEIGPSAEILEASRKTLGYYTLDTRPGCTYRGDITRRTLVPSDSIDLVFCLDVLEHTLNPFAAIAEIRRILRPGGVLIASAPLNVRKHGPTPDCWRFTQDGWIALLRDWDDLEMDVLESERFLFPIHINVKARCNKMKAVCDDQLTFPWID